MEVLGELGFEVNVQRAAADAGEGNFDYTLPVGPVPGFPADRGGSGEAGRRAFFASRVTAGSTQLPSIQPVSLPSSVRIAFALALAEVGFSARTTGAMAKGWPDGEVPDMRFLYKSTAVHSSWLF